MRNCEKYIQNIGWGVGVTGMVKLKADVKCDLKVRSALSRVISVTELRVVCAIAGECGKPTRQPRLPFPICGKKKRNVETVVFKWVIANARNANFEIAVGCESGGTG
jgi:hypothetical protein